MGSAPGSLSEEDEALQELGSGVWLPCHHKACGFQPCLHARPTEQQRERKQTCAPADTHTHTHPDLHSLQRKWSTRCSGFPVRCFHSWSSLWLWFVCLGLM